ncbi:hypothetical protein ElP_28790 [Tautonia plasticadhaerens]|uniref:Uncharacterized protein n=1 Tax=Tautonia plasticadhaerens TaxID=2527974 RepID=A0A518H2A1_9BACT|nr:hypothetical protein ElP_28790 [Tautonia plasticadhaerens]
MTPAEEVRRACQALNNDKGTGGQTKLARLLPLNSHGKPVNSRTVRRWIAGKTEPHPVLLERIRDIREQAENDGQQKGCALAP